MDILKNNEQNNDKERNSFLKGLQDNVVDRKSALDTYNNLVLNNLKTDKKNN